MERHYRVKETAELACVEIETVLWWIETKELKAINVAKNPNGKRPRWRIAETELAKFLLRRQTQDQPLPAKTVRRAQTQRQVVEFYR